MLNLELLLKFGPDAWRLHNEMLGSYAAQVQEQLAAARRAIDALNRERKLQQTAAGREIAALEGEYLALVYKNQEIEAACRAAEREARRMRAAAGSSEEQQQQEQPGVEEEGQQQQQNGQDVGVEVA